MFDDVMLTLDTRFLLFLKKKFIQFFVLIL